MKIKPQRWVAALAVAGAAVMVAPTVASAAPGDTTGPSSSDAPYLVRSAPGVTLTSVLTAGDSIDGYTMAGIPDGLGAYDNGDGTFTVLMNHELGATQGVVRDHGARGAYVSKWIIDKATLQVISGSDLIQTVQLWNGTSFVESAAAAFNRFCAADLAEAGAFYNAESGLGFDGRIFLNGEETTGGRAFGHVVETGESFQLPSLGVAAWENVVANPATGDKTVVAGTSDTAGGPLYVHVGEKKATGNPVEQAGLTDGVRYAVAVAGLAAENSTSAWTGGAPRFTLTTGEGTTAWSRPEDVAWDPNNPNDLYFVTTGSFTQHSRLWKLAFDDIQDPTAGGTLSLVLEGPKSGDGGPRMMDNLYVNDRGQILVQEDPGAQNYLAGIFQVDASTGAFRQVAKHDPNRFLAGGSLFQTIDEESSGIIPLPFLGEGKYLVDVQSHVASFNPEVVQKGQLLVLSVPPGQPISNK